MNSLFALDPPTFWNGDNGSADLRVKIILAFLVGVALIFAFMATPVRWRRTIVVSVTFLAGLFYVLLYFWPAPIARKPDEVPRDFVEIIGFWLADAQPNVVSPMSNILSTFLLGLGVYSVVRIHGRKLLKMQKDWGFSLVLLSCVVLMVFFGYWDYLNRHAPGGGVLEDPSAWHFQQYMSDLLFDGLLQQMDAAMFSVIAFYILSAAYRAFRVRSIEATILLGTALIVMLSLMGAVANSWDHAVNSMSGNNPNSFLGNFRLTDMRTWIQNAIQTPGLRAVDFGIGIGLLAMSLRLWLSLERSGGAQ